MTSTIQRPSKALENIGYAAAGTGETVVFLHGVGMQRAAWRPQFDALKDSYHVLALDLPGHGGTAPLETGGDLSDYVAWCDRTLGELGVHQANLVGHSMGALIALGYAATFPEKTRRVALLNGVYCRDAAARKAVQERAALIRSGNIDLQTPLARWFSDDPSQDQVRREVARWLEAVDPAGYASAYSAFANGDAVYTDAMSQIACPFLALTGDGDPNSTPEMSNDMARRVTDGRSVTLNGHRHMVNLTAPQEVTDHLRVWLQRPITVGGNT